MPKPQRAFEQIDQFAKRWMKEFNIPGLAIVTTDRDQPLRILTRGFADLSTRVPITSDTLFEIGSLGKSFTSIALLQLRDEGRLDLHAPVNQYLPWFRVQSDYQPITVHHLMNHTAGIVRGTDLAPHGLYESWALRETRTTAPPGEYFYYSNIGYKTLGFLLESLTGQSLQRVIKSRILAPLTMTRTFPGVTLEMREKEATGYCGIYDDRPEHRSHKLVPAVWAEYGTGDGCVASTPNDMTIYLRMLVNRGQGPRGRIISEDSFDLMTQLSVWTGRSFYGYGLGAYILDDRTYVSHGGGNGGFRSAIAMDMEAGLGVIFLLNSWGETDPVVSTAHYVLKVLRADKHNEQLPPPPPAEDPRFIHNANDYVGAYCAGDRTLELAARDGRLLLTYEDGVVALERRDADSFYAGHPDFDRFLLEFGREGGKVVEAFHGTHWYINDRYSGPMVFDYPREWEDYLGHYRARSPELASFRVVLRKGALSMITAWGETWPLIPLAGGGFRVGEDSRSPEILQFHAVADGRALRVDYSGCPYYRAFTP